MVPTPPDATAPTLGRHLETAGCPEDLRSVFKAAADACVEISAALRRGALGGVLGEVGTQNVQGEVQKTLDVLSDEICVTRAKACPAIAGCASEEQEDVVACASGGRFLLLFDPLDGSSNTDVTASVGSIFSILPRRGGAGPVTAADFLQRGRDQAGAAYAVYGPQTMFVLSFGAGVFGYTLDPETQAFRLTHPDLKIPRATREFAINMSNERHWAPPVQAYIADCLKGAEGPRGKDFNMRWLAAMVADAHRILLRGGVFLYPWDRREPSRPGKLRLMYEANPLGFLMEAAGGGVFDGEGEVLEISPTAVHQRVSVMMGSLEEIEVLRALHRS